jgi:adenosylhomocysteine nucleosidase
MDIVEGQPPREGDNRPPMKTILFVAADEREFAGVLRHSRQLRCLDWPVDFAREAKFAGALALLVANGPGPRLAGRAVDLAGVRASFDLVVSIGLCGALEPCLKAGEVVVVSRVVPAEGGSGHQVQLPESVADHRTVSLISQDRVAVTVEEKRALRVSGAAVVEMEAYGVACGAARLHLPFACVRVVSDTSEEGFALDLNSMRSADGHFSSARIVSAALRRPARLIPELFRLQRRSRSAALALGDFLATCRF